METRSPIKILVTKATYHNPLIIFALEQSHTYYEAVHHLARALLELRKLPRFEESESVGGICSFLSC